MSDYYVLITQPAEDDLRQTADYIALELKAPSAADLLMKN